MSAELIHHLVAFPAKWIEAQELHMKYQKDLDAEAYLRDFKNNKEIYHAWQMGGNHRGSFTDKQKLIDIIKASTDPYGICEGYYEYLLIETHYMNCIDGHLCEPDYSNEMWFNYVKISDDEWEYQEIPRPECLEGTVNFL